MIAKSAKNRVLAFVIAIFVIAFFWQLFFTYGFKFYWEDFEVYQLREINYTCSKISLLLGICKGFIKDFFSTHRLFQIGFGAYNQVDRPYQFLTWDLMKVCFGHSVIPHRIFKVTIFAINACLVFLIINRASRLLAVLGAFLYILSAELWLSTAYLTDPSIIVQCGEILSVMLFIKLTEKQPLRYRDALFYYLLIMLASNYSVLTSGVARYLAIIFFMTVLFFRRKEFRFHIPMLVILFLMQFPALGYIKMIFSKEPFTPINFASHDGAVISTFESLKRAVSNYKFARNAAGKYVLVALYITIINHLVYYINRLFHFIFRKNSTVSKEANPAISVLKERLFLFMLWFLAALLMCARARSFNYDGAFSVQIADLGFFVAPFIIFFCYYVSLIHNTVKKPYRFVFLTVCVFLIVAQINFNVFRINKFRGGWGNYHCAWQNVEKYIATNSNKALALAFTEMHYKPFAFWGYPGSKDAVLNTKVPYQESEFCDLGFIESKFKEGFKDVFVVARHKLEFRGSSKNVILKQQLNIDGNSGDLYDRIKCIINRGSKPVISLYHFKCKEEIK